MSLAAISGCDSESIVDGEEDMPFDEEPEWIDDEFGLEALEEESLPTSYVIAYSNSTPGSTLHVPASSHSNDRVWGLNPPNDVLGEITVVTADIVHNGFLNNYQDGLDHFEVRTRGINLEQALQTLGLQPDLFVATWLGEPLLILGAQQELWQMLDDVTVGRGSTFWPGNGNQSPYMKFTNTSGGVFGPAVPLTITAAPFQIKVEVDDWDVRVQVWQGGQPKADVRCVEHTGDPARCRATPSDLNRSTGDAVFEWVMGTPSPGAVNRHVGVLNATVQVLEEIPPPPSIPLAVQISCPPNYSPWNQRFRVTITPPISGPVTHYELHKQPVNFYNPWQVMNSSPATVQDISFNQLMGPIRIRARACNAGGCGPTRDAPGVVSSGMCTWNP